MTEPGPRSDLGRATIQGAAWKYLTYFSGKLMVLGTTIILARLLLKDDFGLVGYAITAINFLDVISDLGIGPAVIYHSEDEKLATTAFWIGLLFGVFLLVFAWVGAPYIGVYFRDMRVVPFIRALAFTFPINSLGSIHASVLRKKLAFGRSILPNLFMALTKGVTSIAFAYFGFGAWSLVWGQISGTLISSLTFWFVTPWRPTLFFDLKIARSLMNFGFNIIGMDLLSVLLLNLDYLLVGRYLGSEALGGYTLAFRLPDLVILTFARIIGSVIFPVFTHMREVPGSLGKGFVLVTKYVSLITVPIGLGLALIARPLILTLFTDKWVDTIPALRGIALYGMFLSLAYNAGDAYKAEGRPQIITWLGLVQLALLFPALWWAVVYAGSIAAVGWVQAIVAFVCTILNLYVATRMLGIAISDLANSFKPAFMAGSLMSAVVVIVLMASSNLPAWQQLLLSVIAGGLAYSLVLWILQRQIILEALNRMRSAVSRG